MPSNARSSPKKLASAGVPDAKRRGDRQGTLPAQKNRDWLVLASWVFASCYGAAGLKGGGQGSVVEIIELATDGHSLGEPRHPDIPAGYAVREIMCRGLAVDRRVKCKDQFLTRYEAGKKPVDVEIIRADAVERRQGPAQHGVDEAGDGHVDLQLAGQGGGDAGGVHALGDVTQVLIYMTDVKDMPVIDEVYREFFEAPYPNRSSMGVAGLVVPGMKIEIVAYAVIG